MRLRTQHQPNICADSSGLFLQHAAGPGSVRTWKGTSLWGRGSTPEHAVILVFQKKKKLPWDHECIFKGDTLRHAHARSRTHTHRHAENCVAQQMSRCDIWGWREPTWGGKKRKDGIVNIDCACTDTQSEPIHHSTYTDVEFSTNLMPLRTRIMLAFSQNNQLYSEICLHGGQIEIYCKPNHV